jgi:dUTP pyrophosphatase
MIIEYYMMRQGVNPPHRSNPSDAGLDVYFCPEDNQPVVISPGHNAKLATGLKFGVPHGYMVQVMNRSSMASKRNLIVGAHCIDSGYNGEVFIDLHNVGTEDQVLNPLDKIAQLVLVPIVSFRALQTGEDNLYGWCPITISDRGAGGFGSTGG